MERIRLGRTGLMVSRSGFGCIPIQRISFDEAKKLLLKAYDNGVNFFDTARAYTDSEEKLGYTFSGIRQELIIATKSGAQDCKTLRQELETSLRNLKTDYIDIYQLHNPKSFPDLGDQMGIYSEAMKAKAEGKIRFIGFTNHQIEVALQAVASGAFDTIQFPLSSLSTPEDLEVIRRCEQADLGVIAMKALAGGLITKVGTTFAFLRQYANVVPIWGIQHEWELEQFIALEQNPPQLDNSVWQEIEKDRKELAGSFCRGCGYCLPCPAGIQISTAARMSLLLRRAPYEEYLKDEWRREMERINDCLNCGQCMSKCPYQLNTPELLKRMLADYNQFYQDKKGSVLNG